MEEWKPAFTVQPKDRKLRRLDLVMLRIAKSPKGCSVPYLNFCISKIRTNGT